MAKIPAEKSKSSQSLKKIRTFLALLPIKYFILIIYKTEFYFNKSELILKN